MSSRDPRPAEVDLFAAPRERIGWAISTWRRLSRPTPVEATIAIVATACGELFRLAAFFLPLKVVLLLASPGVPWYFPDALGAWPKERLVLVLVGATVASYLLHLACHAASRSAVERGWRGYLSLRGGSGSPRQRESIIGEGYSRLCRTVASAFLVVLSLAAGMALNPALFAFLIAVTAAQLVGSRWLLRDADGRGRRIGATTATKPPTILDAMVAISFLAGLGFLVGQLLRAAEPNLSVAVASMLLYRQVLASFTTGTRHLTAFSQRRERLSALLADEHARAGEGVPARGRSGAMREGWPRPEWLTAALAEVLPEPPPDVVAAEVGTDPGGVVLFEVLAGGGYLVKRYPTGREDLGDREALLFTEIREGVPCAPRYLGRASQGGDPVLVFAGVPEREPSPREWRRLQTTTLRRLWCQEIDPERLERLLGSCRPRRPLGPQTIEKAGRAVRTEDEARSLATLLAAWPELTARLEAMPLSIANPDPLRELCRVGPNGDPVYLSWSRWTLAPVGWGGRQLLDDPVLLEETLLDVRRARGAPDLSADDLLLAALVPILERALRRRALRHALGTVSRLAELVTAETVPSGLRATPASGGLRRR